MHSSRTREWWKPVFPANSCPHPALQRPPQPRPHTRDELAVEVPPGIVHGKTWTPRGSAQSPVPAAGLHRRLAPLMEDRRSSKLPDRLIHENAQSSACDLLLDIRYDCQALK